jgi:hypothetical protein
MRRGQNTKCPKVLTLKQYLAAEHVGAGIWGELQTLPDKRLAGIGAKRQCPIRVPYFTAAVRCVPGTRLLATVPTRIAKFRSEQSAIENAEAARSAGKIQVSDGLASAHEHRCGAYMAAACNRRNGEGALFRVELQF